MKTGTRTTQARIAALLLGMAMLPACAGNRPGSDMAFRQHDANKDGFLSLDEFKAQDKDELAFKAADINGDGQVDPDEFDRYVARKANDQPQPASEQPMSAPPPSGY
jgi:hypothetical protein